MIELKNISKYYNKSNPEIMAINNISITIKEEKLIAIVGKSGSGKSTLLNILSGITIPNSGDYIFYGKKIKFNDKDLSNLRKQIGLIVQNFALIESRTVFDNIKIPLQLKKIDKLEIKNKVLNVSKQLGISDKLNKYPLQLSGGEMQRVAIARAIVSDCKVILADEPTGALDSTNSNIVLDLLYQISRKGKLVIIVTHDMDIANKCDKIITLSDGKIVV